MESDPIPAAARALVGVTRVRHCQVTRHDIERFRQAIGLGDGGRVDEDDPASLQRPVVAPPLFCQILAYADVPPDRLAPDGSPVELCVPIPAQRTVGGSSDFTIHRPVRAGETITVTSQLKNIHTKQGKSGLLYMVVVETRYDDADGAPVAAETATYVKRV